MPHNDSIRKLLNLKDNNIIFDQEFCTDEKIKTNIAKVFHAQLSYNPIACSNCGCALNKDIIKYGFVTSLIKMPNVSNFDTYLKLKKQRYFCKHCNESFSLPTNIVNRNCYISNSTKLSIALDSREKISEVDIARRHNVSHVTVSNIIDSSYNSHKVDPNYLPKHLNFDEFKSVKSAAGAMSFIYCDSNTRKIVDIVEDRRLSVLKQYFSRFTKAARNSVKTIVVDMYKPYITLIRMLFPRAKIIIDKFHVVQLFSRALNKTRIKIMNQDKKHYNKYKNYWRLLLKDISKINYEDYHYRRCFKNQMREIDIINYLLDLDAELKATYQLYHDIRHCLNTKNIALLGDIIATSRITVSSYMKTSIKTIKKYLDYVENTIKYRYNNGIIEGINNKIKVIKRIAFGYRNFYHFRNRILITQELVKLKAA